VEGIGNVASLCIQILGDFKARDGAGQTITISAKKSRALLAAVALSPNRSMPRERIATLLWSDRGEAQARSSLRQTLTILRKELVDAGSTLFITDDERVDLPEASVEIDAVTFLELASSHEAAALQNAVELYRGELLEDTFITDPAYEEWIAGERRRFRNVMTGVLERLIPQLAPAQRAGYARRLLDLDPLQEPSHLILMQALADAGDRAQALQHYGVCRDLLKAELGILPSREIEQFRHQLQSNHPAPPPASAAAVERVTAEKPSIVVLPFVNLSGDPGQQYLSDGITEDIIIQLARFNELKVTARAAAFRFQGGDVDSGEVAQSVGARYVVKGTVRRTGTRLVISCQLLEGATENLLWGERYDREAADIFSVQDEVVARIVTALGGRLVTAGAISIRRKPTENWSAYDYFLKGRDLCNLGREEASEPFFAKTVELDPDFALAHAWLAIGFLGKFWTLGDRKFLDKALASAERALALDANEAMAHHATGTALNYMHKYHRSEFHLRRAAELNPLEVNVSADYANLLLHTGRHVEALAMIEEVMRRDPYPPPWIRYMQGKILFFTKRFDEALQALDNGSVYTYRAHALMAAAHAILGNLDEARRHVDLMRAAKPDVSLGVFVVTMGFADPAVLDFFLDALRRAGFDD
jgi:TolB-like protein